MSQKITHLSVDVDLIVVNVTRDKNGTMIGVSVSAKKNNKTYHMWKGLCMESSICACECDKDCEYLKDCEPMKVLVDDVVATCDEI